MGLGLAVDKFAGITCAAVELLNEEVPCSAGPVAVKRFWL